MATVHFLNVAPGDCTVIQHGSGRVSMIDICDGNIDEVVRKAMIAEATRTKPRGNFRMCRYPTNPIEYVRELGIERIWRFILTHPDMDHMDGLDRLVTRVGINNFWDTGVTRDAPEFGEGCPYDEADWKCYLRLRDGKVDDVTSLTKTAGARFKHANLGADGEAGGDALYILAPNDELVAEASEGDDINDGSYVLLYRSSSGRVLIPGDAHDATWKYVLDRHPKSVANCSVMIAPHHGRHSERSFEFLDSIRPKLTLFGCAPASNLAYDAWNSRRLDFITSNQAGNIVLETADDAFDVYVENEVFAEAKGCDSSIRNKQGYVWLQRIPETNE